MTYREALCAVLLQGAATPNELDVLRAEPWFDADCADVLCAVSALRELGQEIDRVEVVKVYVARGYGIQEAVERVRELWGLANWHRLMSAAQHLHELAEERRAV